MSIIKQLNADQFMHVIIKQAKGCTIMFWSIRSTVPFSQIPDSTVLRCLNAPIPPTI